MKKSKVLKRTLFIFVGVIIILIAIFFSSEYISNVFVKNNLTSIIGPDKNSRVMIFAPHCDDEVLGASSFIRKAIENGGKVKVVIVTNGDGFKNAVQINYLRINPSPKDYVNFGYTRQKESIKALKELGVSENDITFLGYPDGGLYYLWSSNWDKVNPYRSLYTNEYKSPYKNSYTKNSIYSGESVVNDITKIINDFRPTDVVFPHPNDRHPDHLGTNALVKYAITLMNYDLKHEWLYLVHRGDWPTPMNRNVNMYLVPPAKLIGMGTDWYALDMNSNEIGAKSNAIECYRTQMRPLRLLLTAFERKNEIFGCYKNIEIVKYQKLGNDIVSSKKNKVINDPIQDKLNLEISKSSDISGIYSEISKEGNLYIFIETDGKLEESIKYELNMVLFNNKNTSRLNIVVKNKRISLNKKAKNSILNSDGITEYENKNIMRILIPKELIKDTKNIYINSNSYVEDHILDRTAWRMISIK